MKTASIVPFEAQTLSWPILYTRVGCPWCVEARAALDRHEIRYLERSVTTDDAAFAEMRRLSGQTKAPVLDWADEMLADFGAADLEFFLAALVYSGKVRL